MAIHTTLPIYREAYRLFDVIMDLTKNMPREFKQSIGGKLRNECIEIMTLIFRANTMQDRAGHLLDLIERLQVAELLLRLSRDKRLISTARAWRTPCADAATASSPTSRKPIGEPRMPLPNDVARCNGIDCPSAMNCQRYTERAVMGDRTPMAAMYLRREAGADACDQIIPVRPVSTFEVSA